jgi:hypothetical protein
MNSMQATSTLNRLVGCQLVEFSNMLGTWVCEFQHPEVKDARYKLFIECPWRVVEESRLVFGSDDLRIFWEEFQDDIGASPFGVLFVEVLGLEQMQNARDKDAFGIRSIENDMLPTLHSAKIRADLIAGPSKQACCH